MHHDYVFLITHLGADTNPLVGSMNTHPEISVTMNQLVYATPPDLLYLRAACEQVKPARIYVATILQNHTFRCPSLYYQCKFIYFLDEPNSTISAILETQYKPETILSYYAFRLQRIAQMAKETTNAMLITWKDINPECGEKLTEFLHLKKPLSVFCGAEKEIPEMTTLGEQSHSIFNKYFSKIEAVFAPEHSPQLSEEQQPS